MEDANVLAALDAQADASDPVSLTISEKVMLGRCIELVVAKLHPCFASKPCDEAMELMAMYHKIVPDHMKRGN